MNESKKEFIAHCAMTLMKENRTISGAQLAATLNAFGYETSYETPYKENGGRGIFKLIKDTYKFYKDRNEEVANAITLAFVDKENEFAWDK